VTDEVPAPAAGGVPPGGPPGPPPAGKTPT
jgi:hypothetical protein